jgi:predicted branched-subunit amino acid permease
MVPEGVNINVRPAHIGITRRLHLKKRVSEKKPVPLFALLRTDEGFAAFENHLRERDKAYVHQLHFWRLIETFKLSWYCTILLSSIIHKL